MIVFQFIRWKNLLSTGGSFTEVKLDANHTTLVIGENGSGKSTVLDALCFALFGKPFRNISKTQLVNSINNGKAIVEVEFLVGTKEYKIVRGIKPNVFEIWCNGEMMNQDAALRDYQKHLEDHILKLNYRSFTQIVILGSASFTPFMQLSAAHRREIIEDLLDIKIFSTMNDVLKEKQTDLKNKLGTLESSMEIQKTKVSIQQDYIKTLEADKTKRNDEINKEIEKTNSEITQHNSNVVIFSSQIESLQSTISDSNDQQSKRDKLKNLRTKLDDKIRQAKRVVEFYYENDICPTCDQQLEESHKHQAVNTNESKLSELADAITQITSQLEEVESRVAQIAEVQGQINEINSEIIKTNNQIIAAQKYIQKLQSQIESETNDSTSVADEKSKLKEIATLVIDLAAEKSEITEERHYLDVAGILLKDTGIKTKIINQYLPVINKLVNKYLSAMDFFVHFELDGAFNETIKSRHRDDFSYASFSEGEKQRIDLALLFAWRTIAKMKNSANTNLLMLDEVFDSSLDINGTDFVMTLLNTIGDDTNVFVISHKSALHDKFTSVIEFEKHQNFSRIRKSEMATQ